MKLSILKKIRVILALFFFLLLSAVFIDFRSTFGETFYQWAVSLQFVPALLKTITVAGVVAWGLIAVLALTLLFGRVYCSAICPLGILQDIVSWFSRKVKKKHRYKFRKAWTITRYSILGVLLLVVLFGGITLLTVLDPYSLFGRIASYLFKPIVVWVNNLGAAALSSADVYSILYQYDLAPVQLTVLGTTLLFFILVIVMAFNRGRLYCNSVCPVGTVLGFLSKYSLFKIELDHDTCTQCGKCMRVCKAECISIKTQTIDYSRCVACYNCIDTCPEDAAVYRISRKGKKEKTVEFKPVDMMVAQPKGPQMSKRSFLFTAGAGMAAVAGLASVKKVQAAAVAQKDSTTVHTSNGGKIPENKQYAVSPPGSESIERFNDICTGCSLCVSACPSKVLQPSFLEYGLAGMLQPHMDFHAGLCNFDCTTCGEVCPTGAIRPLTVDQKHVTQIGKAHFIKANCIVETDGTDCGACSEHCPTKAVHMVPYGDLVIPEVTEDICVGCGACEHACPVTPHKAIYVDGNPVHLEAKKPETEKAKSNLKADEFPF